MKNEEEERGKKVKKIYRPGFLKVKLSLGVKSYFTQLLKALLCTILYFLYIILSILNPTKYIRI